MIIKILYPVFLYFFAKWNKDRIIKDKKIYHGLNGLLHLLVAAVSVYLCGVITGFVILFEARIFFDGFLNYLRFGNIDYTPASPKSWIDIFEKKIFDDKSLAILVEVYVLVILISL